MFCQPVWRAVEVDGGAGQCGKSVALTVEFGREMDGGARRFRNDFTTSTEDTNYICDKLLVYVRLDKQRQMALVEMFTNCGTEYHLWVMQIESSTLQFSHLAAYRITMSSLRGIAKTQHFTCYLRMLLAAELGNGPEIGLPDCSLEFLQELHFSVKLVKRAVQNKSKSLW
jgi:hypothetical protein